MKERPILFSGPMVRAILADTKTQTRRLVAADWWRCLDPDDAEDRTRALTMCPYGVPGDRLWVRETWRAEERKSDNVDGVRLAADDAFIPIASTSGAADAWAAAYDNGRHGTHWRPSIFMPRWASRITIEVTSTRVERLQEICAADALAEGVDPYESPSGPARPDPRGAFIELWERINGKRATWSSNPWVWVVEFKRIAQSAEAT